MQEDCTRVVQETTRALGGLDIIVSNAGWTKFTDFGNLYSMTEDEWDKVGSSFDHVVLSAGTTKKQHH